MWVKYMTPSYFDEVYNPFSESVMALFKAVSLIIIL